MEQVAFEIPFTPDNIEELQINSLKTHIGRELLGASCDVYSPWFNRQPLFRYYRVSSNAKGMACLVQFIADGRYWYKIRVTDMACTKKNINQLIWDESLKLNSSKITTLPVALWVGTGDKMAVINIWSILMNECFHDPLTAVIGESFHSSDAPTIEKYIRKMTERLVLHCAF